MTPDHAPIRFAIRDGCFVLDGRPFVIRCGEIHCARVPRDYWQHRLEALRAMGLNTVCLYLFWNYHEGTPGVFDFQGERDVAEFCKIAQKLGLWVILRPGPYACAEWDFGGLPAWLLKDPAMQLRSSYPGFLTPAVRWLEEVGRELAALQITRGGNILLVQVENEYGAFGNDKTYLRTLKEAIRAAGFDVPLIRCDWANLAQIVPGEFDPEVAMVANFGSKARENISTVAKSYPTSPRMCGEFWMGWFDWFGHPRNGRTAEDGRMHLPDLQWMLENDVSFSLYMFHGGTKFGFTAGANGDGGRYDPYPTSYDFFAPLDEQGRPRPKFFLFRDAIARSTGETFPEPPPPIPVTKIPEFQPDSFAPFLPTGESGEKFLSPPTMEALGQSLGCLLYRTDLHGRAAGTAELRLVEVHDFAWVFVNGLLVGTMDRHRGIHSVELTIPAGGPANLEILVEAMGHMNFGAAMNDDRKGITRRVEFGHLTLFNWEIFRLPLDGAQLTGLRFSELPIPAGRPAFFRGQFRPEGPGDTWPDMGDWGKGYVWVNGRLLGRYWRIGPQQTLYLPGTWLRPDTDNDIVVLDFHNAFPERPRLRGLTEPVLDEVRPYAFPEQPAD
ncbi:MAG: beta-galactosidase [Terrimicrobiaceae bacterium]|nr:beta-galactosidase [Terrimicrobiaceae bacterium]